LRSLLASAFVATTVAAAVIAGLISIRWRAHHRPALLVELRAADSTKPDLEAWSVFFRSLFGITPPAWKRWLAGVPRLAFEFVAEDGRVCARCWLPADLEPLVSTLLRTASPGIDLAPVHKPAQLPGPAVRAQLELWREPLYPLVQPRTDGLRSVIDAVSSGGRSVVQLVVTPDAGWQGRALRRLDELAGIASATPLPARIISALVGVVFDLVWSGDSAIPPEPRSYRNAAPPPDKAGQPGYRVAVRVRTAAPTRGMAKQRLHALVSAFRAFDGLNGLRPRRAWIGSLFDRAMLARQAPSAASVVLVPDELAALFHLPVAGADMEAAPVRLAPPRPVRSAGKVLCIAEDGRETPVAISQGDCRHHVHALGPIGVGKSTLLLNLALQDIEDGRGTAVFDPKGDLIRDLLERIPRSEADRIVLVDPAQRDRPVGINVLECEDADLYEVVTDQLVTVFRRSYQHFWGPRTDDVLRAAILTLLHRRGATVCEVPVLLLRPQVRRHMVGLIDDPVGLEPFWEEYERISEAQRLQMVGPVLNKLRAVLMRRTVRNILGQSRSTINLSHILDHQGILLVNLAKGLLGEDTSRLFGAFLVSRLWQTAQARSDRPESQRPDFNVYLDEFQNYLHLPQTMEDVLVELRSLHVGLLLANQHYGQIPPAIREAVVGNVRTRVVFQLGQEDSRYVARGYEPWLSDHDLQNLQLHQVAVRLCVNGRTERPFTGLTLPKPDSLGHEHARLLAEAALRRYGRPRSVVEAEIIARLAPPRDAQEDAAA
jgi:hypothetical protein